jgi:hypothetical protein
VAPAARSAEAEVAPAERSAEVEVAPPERPAAVARHASVEEAVESSRARPAEAA